MRKHRLFLLGLALLLSVFWAGVRLEAPYYLELLEFRFIDFRLQVRGRTPVGEEVAIVAVDEKSLQERGRWPWPRFQLARLVSQLTDMGAAVIALDIVFAEPDPDYDQQLAEAIRRSGRVVLGYFLDFAGGEDPRREQGQLVSAYNLVGPYPNGASGGQPLRTAPRLVNNIPPIASSARHAGFFNLIPDVDGIHRRALLAVRYQDKVLTPLSLETLRLYLENPLLSIAFQEYGVASIALAGAPLPIDEEGELWINYTGPAHSFPHYSATDVIAGRTQTQKIQGKIILVGATATGIFDQRATSFDPVSPGVEIHATIIDNVLRGQFLVRPKWVVAADIGTILTLGLLLGTALLWIKGIWSGVLCAGVVSAYLWGSQLFFVHSGIPLSTIYPLLSIFSLYPSVILFRYVTEEREKRQIRAAFGLYLHPEVARMVSEDPTLLRLGGEKQELTVMFTDIRDFTSISETFEPEALVEFLNEYLGAMTDIVFAHNGLLDKYIGDAVMALWGAPIPLPDHAAKACRTALDMRDKLEDLHRDWDARGLPSLEIGIGINTGPMVVGNMGSHRRFNYTVMGDHVNLASRLEGLNKVYGTHILLSQYAHAQLGEEFLLREIDAVRVKGKQQPVAIYELLARADQAAGLYPFATAFAEALQIYKDRRWEKALHLFSQLHATYPEDGPTQIYVERSRLFMAKPPPHEWDGVFEALTK